MYKHLLLLLMSLSFLGKAFSQGSFQIHNVDLRAGVPSALNVSLQNYNPVIGFQFDLNLPEGISVDRENGDYKVELSGRKDPSHFVSCNRLSSGSYRIVVSSLSNALINTGSGDVLSIQLLADKSIPKTEYPYSLTNGLIVWQDQRQTKIDVLNAQLNVKENAQFTFTPQHFAPGELNDFAVSLNNSDAVTAFQCDLILPEGVSVSDESNAVSLTDRKQDHTISYRSIGNNTYRIIALSMSNKPFKGLDGPLFNVKLKISPSQKEGISRIFLKNNIASLDKDMKLSLDDVTNTLTIEKIKINVSSIGQGAVSGGGSFNYHDQVSLKAIPDIGFKFVKWASDGVPLSNEAEFAFLADKPQNITGEFIRDDQFMFSVTATGENGTITGSGIYTWGSEATMVATPNEGYNFVRWMVDGKEVSRESTYRFTVKESVNLVAEFALQSFEVTATGENGTITGSGNYTWGSEATMVATPNEGYNFVRWSVNGEEVSRESTYRFTVKESVNLVAEFALQSFEVTATGENGTITGSGNYTWGSEATMVATPNEGYNFVRWMDDGKEVSRESTYRFTVKESVNLVAEFALQSFEVTATGENGTITGSGIYTWGSEATMVAIPNEGYNFVRWMVDGKEVSRESTYRFTVKESVNLVAEFALQSFEVTATGENGTITGSGIYTWGSEATMVATPNEGYNFVRWMDDGKEVSRESTYRFTVKESVNLVAEFALQSFEVTATGENGTITGSGNYTWGSEATMVATPNEGYNFVRWMVDGKEVSRESTYRFTVKESINLVAEFALQSFEVTATGENGTITGSGNYTWGSEATMVATPNEGYNFVRWSVNGEEVSRESTYRFTVKESVNLVAEFALQSFEVTATGENGTITGSGIYTWGSEATMVATPNEGYNFVRWMVDGKEVSRESTYRFTVKESVNLVAEFALQSFEVTATGENGTITGSGNYTWGSEATMVATPNEGYNFVRWMVDGKEVSRESTYCFKVKESVNLIAEFVLQSFEVTATGENGTVTGSGNYTWGSEATMVATPNEGYNFVRWMVDGKEVSRESTYRFTVKEPVNLVAEFALQSFEVTATGENGFVDGSGFYNYGEEVVLRATAAEGYGFKHWIENDIILSTEQELRFNIVQHRAIKAIFEPITSIDDVDLSKIRIRQTSCEIIVEAEFEVEQLSLIDLNGKLIASSCLPQISKGRCILGCYLLQIRFGYGKIKVIKIYIR